MVAIMQWSSNFGTIHVGISGNVVGPWEYLPLCFGTLSFNFVIHLAIQI
jgi:hypothetical protein